MAAQTGFDAWTGTAHMRKNFMRNAVSDVFVNDQRTKFLFCRFVRPMGAFFVPQRERRWGTREEKVKKDGGIEAKNCFFFAAVL